MIHPSPIIAVDDNQGELDAIVAELRRQDLACLPVKVTSVKPDIRKPLKGVRLVFFDINYLPGTASDAVLFNTAAAVLEQVLAPDNGPYVLITWSSKSDKHEQLMQHFADQVPEIPAPAASGFLRKELFTTPRPKGSAPLNLAQEIRMVLEAHPQVEALMQWEGAARRAAGEVICSLLDLTPRSARFQGTASNQLHGILSKVAVEAVGEAGAKADRRGAVHEALVPILFDRLVHHDAIGGEAEMWARAIDFKTAPVVSQADGRLLNGLSHIARKESGPMDPGDRGVVFTVPPSAAGLLADRTGLSLAKIAADFVQMQGLPGNQPRPPVDLAVLDQHARWVFVGVRAICDQAHDKGVLRPVVLGLEIPADWKVGKGGPLQRVMHGALSETPAFALPAAAGAALPARRLLIDWHWAVSLSAAEMARADVLYRIREPLMSQVSTQMGGYISRPGIINFDA